MKKETLEIIRKSGLTLWQRALNLLPKKQRVSEAKIFFCECLKQGAFESAFAAFAAVARNLSGSEQQEYLLRILRRFPAERGKGGSQKNALRIIQGLQEPQKTQETDRVLIVLVREISALDNPEELIDLILTLSDASLTQKHFRALFYVYMCRGLHTRAMKVTAFLKKSDLYQQKVIDVLIAQGDHEGAENLTVGLTRGRLTSKELERCLRVRIGQGRLMKAIDISRCLGRNLTVKEIETLFLVQTKAGKNDEARETLEILLGRLERKPDPEKLT